jgi:hypothetical protein
VFMSKYFDGFIEQQRSRGVPVTPELLRVNKELKVKDEAKLRYANRDFWCRIGLHSWRQHWAGGFYPKSCDKCMRDLL